MLGWFFVIALLGIYASSALPMCLPREPLMPQFLIHQELLTSASPFSGAAFLAPPVTGGEAMMPRWHLSGANPARMVLRLPCLALVLNYFGQAALLSLTPARSESVLSAWRPDWAHYRSSRFCDGRTVIARRRYLRRVFTDAAGDPARLPSGMQIGNTTSSHDRPD